MKKIRTSVKWFAFTLVLWTGLAANAEEAPPAAAPAAPAPVAAAAPANPYAKTNEQAAVEMFCKDPLTKNDELCEEAKKALLPGSCASVRTDWSKAVDSFAKACGKAGLPTKSSEPGSVACSASLLKCQCADLNVSSSETTSDDSQWDTLQCSKYQDVVKSSKYKNSSKVPDVDLAAAYKDSKLCAMNLTGKAKEINEQLKQAKEDLRNAEKDLATRNESVNTAAEASRKAQEESQTKLNEELDKHNEQLTSINEKFGEANKAVKEQAFSISQQIEAKNQEISAARYRKIEADANLRKANSQIQDECESQAKQKVLESSLAKKANLPSFSGFADLMGRNGKSDLRAAQDLAMIYYERCMADSSTQRKFTNAGIDFNTGLVYNNGEIETLSKAREGLMGQMQKVVSSQCPSPQYPNQASMAPPDPNASDYCVALQQAAQAYDMETQRHTRTVQAAEAAQRNAMISSSEKEGAARKMLRSSEKDIAEQKERVRKLRLYAGLAQKAGSPTEMTSIAEVKSEFAALETVAQRVLSCSTKGKAPDIASANCTSDSTSTCAPARAFLKHVSGADPIEVTDRLPAGGTPAAPADTNAPKTSD